MSGRVCVLTLSGSSSSVSCSSGAVGIDGVMVCGAGTCGLVATGGLVTGGIGISTGFAGSTAMAGGLRVGGAGLGAATGLATEATGATGSLDLTVGAGAARGLSACTLIQRITLSAWRWARSMELVAGADAALTEGTSCAYAEDPAVAIPRAVKRTVYATQAGVQNPSPIFQNPFDLIQMQASPLPDSGMQRASMLRKSQAHYGIYPTRGGVDAHH